MTTEIYFIRHGSHRLLDHILCGRLEGVSLGAEGLEQAARIAQALARQNLSAVYASPLQRAIETAEPLARAIGQSLQTADALNEINMGDWTGAAFDTLAQDPAWRKWNEARSHHRAPGGENMLEVQVRVASWIDWAAGGHPGGRVAAVCHADVIKAAICHALGLPLDQIHRFEINPGSISVIVAGDWGLKVNGVNEAPR